MKLSRKKNEPVHVYTQVSWPSRFGSPRLLSVPQFEIFGGEGGGEFLFLFRGIGLFLSFETDQQAEAALE